MSTFIHIPTRWKRDITMLIYLSKWQNRIITLAVDIRNRIITTSWHKKPNFLNFAIPSKKEFDLQLFCFGMKMEGFKGSEMPGRRQDRPSKWYARFSFILSIVSKKACHVSSSILPLKRHGKHNPFCNTSYTPSLSWNIVHSITSDCQRLVFVHENLWLIWSI